MEFSTRSQALSPERVEKPPMFRGRSCVGARNSDVRGQIKENRFGQPPATLIDAKKGKIESGIL
jgi:hypothetical protein